MHSSIAAFASLCLFPPSILASFSVGVGLLGYGFDSKLYGYIRYSSHNRELVRALQCLLGLQMILRIYRDDSQSDSLPFGRIFPWTSFDFHKLSLGFCQMEPIQWMLMIHLVNC